MADENSIVRMLNDKIREHEQKIKSLRDAIRALGGKSGGSAISSGTARKRRRGCPAKGSAKAKGLKPAKAKKAPKPPREGTMESWVIKQLEDGVPKTSRTLLELFNSTSDKKLNVNGFAARMSILKNKGNIRSMKNPADKLSYVGKAEWFENGKMKGEYFSKIKS